MLPAAIVAKAIQVCAAGLGTAGLPAPKPYAVTVHAGAILDRQPSNEVDAEATVQNLLALGADFEAGPLGINGRDFSPFGVTPASVFDACALAHIDENLPASAFRPTSVARIASLLHQAFGARITDAVRPINANYGARYSWHKVGQAIDFVPVGGVNAISRGQIRTLMDKSGIRLIELLGPGDRGHANHWHIAFALPGQATDRIRPVASDEVWLVDVGSVAVAQPRETDALSAPSSPAGPAAKAPQQWDVFAAADWRAIHGGGS
jgi:hypothetical protein